MSRPAFQAIMMWDDPRQFEDQEVYQAVHQLVTILLEYGEAVSRLNESEHHLLQQLVAGSMDAVSEAIKNNSDSESSGPLVEILEDLVKFSEEITESSPQ